MERLLCYFGLFLIFLGLINIILSFLKSDKIKKVHKILTGLLVILSCVLLILTIVFFEINIKKAMLPNEVYNNFFKYFHYLLLIMLGNDVIISSILLYLFGKNFPKKYIHDIIFASIIVCFLGNMFLWGIRINKYFDISTYAINIIISFTNFLHMLFILDFNKIKLKTKNKN